MSSGATRILSVALALAAGCDVTVPWGSVSRPDAPSGFAAAAVPWDFDTAQLSWSPRPGVDGYELEARLADGTWQPLGAALPGNAAGLHLGFAPSAPEATWFTFRLRARAGGRVSPWVEASFLRGVRAPSAVTVEVASQSGHSTGPITIAWTNASSVATEVWVERTAQGPVESWITLPGATLASGVHVDRLLEDGASYTYRVRVGRAGIWSEPRSAWSSWPVDLAAPWGLTARRVEGGVQLDWTNQSTTATSMSLRAALGGDFWGGRSIPLDGLPSTAFDAAEPVWPATEYRVEIEREWRRATSEVARLAPFTVAGPPALTASPVILPPAREVARAAQGRFHLVSSGYPSPTLHRALADGGHVPHALEDAWGFVSPGLAAGADGHPHAVFTRLTGSGVVDVVHEWWNGSTWDTDVVLTGVSTSWRSPSFALGSAGALHLLYQHWQSPFRLVHVLRAAGATTETEVTAASAPADFAASLGAFAAASDGTAYLARLGYSWIANSGNGGSFLVVATRSASGTWSDETRSTDANGRCLSLAPGAGGDLAVAYCRNDGATPPGDEVRVLRRKAGTWQTAETALTRPFDGYTFELAFAGAPDLSKLVLSDGGAPATLHVRDAQGWKAVAVGPGSVKPFVGVGPSGAWALYPHDAYATGPVPFSLFEELP